LNLVLAPTVGTTGSGSTDSPAPSPTTTIDTVINTAIDIVIKTAIDTIIDTAIDTVIDTAIDTVIDTAIDTVIDTSIDAVTGAAIDIAPSITDNIIGSTSPTVNVDSIKPTATLGLDIDLVAAAIIGSILGSAGPTSARTGGFDMAFGLFNFHVDDDGIAELISVSNAASPTADPSAPSAAGSTPSTTTPPTPSEEEPRAKTSTPSVGSNDFQDLPPSPTTAYCIECDAYHFMGTGDFFAHEITGCEDPQGGTTAIYLTISECERALNTLTLCPTPYDPDYVDGLYSDYTCSDDDIYPEAKGVIGHSTSSYSSESAASGDRYMADYDSDIMIEVGPCIEDDDIYPTVLGKISDDSILPFGGHCMMASHEDGNEHRANDNRNRTNTGCQFITQDQIRLARRVYAGEATFGPNPSTSDLAALRFIVQEQKDQISADRQILERHREEADASSRRRAERSSHYSSSVQHRMRSRTQPGADVHNITRNLEAEFNDAELMPKTKEAAIMAAAAYIAANASNGDEHMRHLWNLALEGVRVLQGTTNQGHEATPRRTIRLQSNLGTQQRRQK
jgi:hypothetical protein